MNVNYNRFLTKLAGIVGLTSVSLLITLPSGANEVLNPNPSIFSEGPYNRNQRIQVNNAYTATKPEVEATKNAKGKKPVIAQNSGESRPRPSIFNEPPYNRGNRTTPVPTTAPEPTLTTPPTETPQTTEPTNTPPAAGTTDTQGKNLVALVEGNKSFTKLTQALKAAGLRETLQGKDNFTIFAPTDEAFAELPQDAVQDLFKPENKEVLVKLLTYHVVSGQVLSSDLKSGEVKSIEGGAINVKVDPKTGVTVNDAKVVEADIKGSNGVIHAINRVILPPDF